MKTQNIEN